MRHAPAPLTGQSSRTWIGWTSTGALAAGALVAGALGASAANELDDLRGTPGVARAELDQARDRTQTRLLVADLLAASAVVCGGVTLYFQLARSPTSPKAEARAPLKLVFAASSASVTFEY